MAAKTDTTKLDIRPREGQHSRESRRLRRSGRVPGVLYGRGGDPIPFEADERELRHALQASGAVIELALDGNTQAAVAKDVQRHPVRGELIHVDMLRVDLKVAIQAPVAVHLVGAESAPGVIEGGVLEHVVREVNVEALPNDIPESIDVDVSGMQVNDTLTLSVVTPPAGVTLLDDLEETVVATITPPRLSTEPTDEIEAETGVVGEGAGEAEGSAQDADAGEVDAESGSADSSS